MALKDALALDDSKNAAGLGEKLFDAFAKFDISAQAKQQQKELCRIDIIAGNF